MADIDYTRLTEAILDGMSRVGGAPYQSTMGAAPTPQEKAEAEARRKNEAAIRKATYQLENFDFILKQNATAASKFEQLLKSGSIPLANLQKELEELDEAIEKITDQTEKQAKQEERDTKASKIRNGLMLDSTLNLTTSLAKTGATFAEDMAGLAKKTIMSLQSGGNSAQVFGSMFTGIIGALQKTVGSLGTAFGAVGQAVGNIFPKSMGKGVGVFAQGLGQAVGAAAGIIGGVLVSGLEILVTEIEKTINAYAAMNQAGAVFAGGMTEMRNTAHSAGLTLETLAKVVSQNSETIARAGLGVTEGTKRIAGALRIGGDTLRNELLSLGFSIEEQGTLVAETMRGMAGLAGPLKASDQEIAIETRKYAENLRLISAITGEDARKKMEQARQDMNNLRFQQILNKLNDKQRLQIETAMNALPSSARKMAIEIANTGTIFTPALAAIAKTTPELEALAKMAAEGAKSGSLNIDQVMDFMSKNRDAIDAGINKATDLAIAGYARPDSIAGEMSRILLETAKEVQKFTKDAIEKARGTIPEAAQAAEKDPMTGAIVSIQKSANDLKVVVETEITNLMSTFAKALKDNVETIASGIKALADAFRDKGIVEGLKELTKQVGNVLEKNGVSVGAKDIAGVAGGVVGAGAGTLLGAGVGSTVGKALAQKPVQTITRAGVKRILGGLLGGAGALLGGGIGSVLTGGLGYVLGDKVGEELYDLLSPFFADTEKRAAGGPVNRNTPYIVGEQGPELRVFEKDGAIVPNNMLMDLLNGTGAGLAGLMTNMQRGVGLQGMADLFEGLTQSLSMFVDKLTSALSNLQVTVVQPNVTAEKLIAASLAEDVAALGRFISKTDLQKIDMVGDIRDVMQQLTDSNIENSERIAGIISAQLQKTIAEPGAAARVQTDSLNTDLKSMIQNQNGLYELTVRQQYDILTVMSDMRNIQQQILNNSV